MTGKQKLAKANARMEKLLKKIKGDESNTRKAVKDNGKEYMGEKDPTAKKKPTKRTKKGVKNGR